MEFFHSITLGFHFTITSATFKVCVFAYLPSHENVLKRNSNKKTFFIA